jgi:hypothetical protein
MVSDVNRVYKSIHGFPGFFENALKHWNFLSGWNQLQESGTALFGLEYMKSFLLFRTVDNSCWNTFKNVQNAVSPRFRFNSRVVMPPGLTG